MLKKGRATGVDGVSLEKYDENLERNLTNLVKKLKEQAYKPKPVKRVYIPKANGKMRPLGIPSVEDKIVQMGITKILTAIWEVDFLDNSYGFRPKRSCHQALEKLRETIMTKRVDHIIDADIKGFFDNVDHGWMKKALKMRISDAKLLKLIMRFLKSGVMEEGKLEETDKGTPQGGILSPVLANIYLHYIIDKWIETVVKKKAKGFVEMVRYADDFVICVNYRNEAKAILESLKKRLKTYGLELAEDKTRIIEFGRFAKRDAKSSGRKVESFKFLGFLHYCSESAKGKFKIGRVSDSKKMKAKVAEMKSWLYEVAHKDEIQVWWSTFCAKLRGHFQYYGISGNSEGIRKFYNIVTYLLFKILNNRSQKRSCNWAEFGEYLYRHHCPKPKIYHSTLAV
jgi:group II intron reverse transcriptase/maturase